MHQEYLNQNGNHNDNIVDRFETMLLYQKVGYFDVEDFVKLIDFYLNHMKVKKSLMVVEEAMKQHPGSTELDLCKARVLFKMGKYKLALKIVDDLSYKSFDEEVLMLQAEILLRLEQFQAADDIFNFLIDNLNEEVDRLCLDIAFMYMGIQKMNIALFYLKKGYDMNPSNLEILFELALYAEEHNKNDLAIEYYNQLLDVDSFNAEAWFNIGMSYASLEKYEDALHAFEFVLVIDKGFYNAYFQKGIALLKLERHQEALDTFNGFIETNAGNDEVQIYLAECYEGIGDYSSAEATYYRILDSDPEVYDAWIGLGYCKQANKDYIESVNCFKKALDMDQDDDEVWAGIGESYLYAGLKNEASSAFAKSLKLNPMQEDVWVMLAAIRIENEELSEAKSALTLATSLYPKSEGLKELSLLVNMVNTGKDEPIIDDSRQNISWKNSQEKNVSKWIARQLLDKKYTRN